MMRNDRSRVIDLTAPDHERLLVAMLTQMSIYERSVIAAYDEELRRGASAHRRGRHAHPHRPQLV